MKNFLLLFILLYLSCSRGNFTDAKIEYIEVYKTSFGISVPLFYDEAEARTWTPYRIDNHDDLRKIKELLTVLVDSGNSKFDMANVYMTCDVFLENGRKKVLYYDKFKMKFDGKVYENSPALIELLASRPNSSDN